MGRFKSKSHSIQGIQKIPQAVSYYLLWNGDVPVLDFFFKNLWNHGYHPKTPYGIMGIVWDTLAALWVLFWKKIANAVGITCPRFLLDLRNDLKFFKICGIKATNLSGKIICPRQMISRDIPPPEKVSEFLVIRHCI